jgi:prepilin-type N-terminal cleavage/methylation domain-containing protein
MKNFGAPTGTGATRRRGFTLVELVVATGITVVLAAMLLSASGNILSAWNRSRGKLVTSNQAKLGLDQLADDLESLVLRSDGNAWFAATVTDLQTGTGDAAISDAVYTTSKPMAAGVSTVLAPTGRDLADYRFGHVGVWLRFFANQQNSNAGADSMSAIRAMAYQVARLPVSGASGNPPRYFLFRSAVREWDSGGNPSTFSTGYDIVGNNAYNDGGSSGGSEPGSVRTPDRSLIVGNDVIDFGVRIFDRDSTGNLVERFPVDRTQGTPPQRWAYLATTNTAAVPVAPGTAPTGLDPTPSYGFPAVIEVMIRVLTDEGADLILALETGKITPPGGAGNYDSYWWELANAHSSVYTRRVEVKSRPFATR